MSAPPGSLELREGQPEGPERVHERLFAFDCGDVVLEGTHEVVDEGGDLLVGLGPVELAVCVLDEAIERRTRRLDEVDHTETYRDVKAM
jgi:hypothetical protein